MGSDVDAVTKSGRLFHTRAAAHGKGTVANSGQPRRMNDEIVYSDHRRRPSHFCRCGRAVSGYDVGVVVEMRNTKTKESLIPTCFLHNFIATLTNCMGEDCTATKISHRNGDTFGNCQLSLMQNIVHCSLFISSSGNRDHDGMLQ